MDDVLLSGRVPSSHRFSCRHGDAFSHANELLGCGGLAGRVLGLKHLGTKTLVCLGVTRPHTSPVSKGPHRHFLFDALDGGLQRPGAPSGLVLHSLDRLQQRRDVGHHHLAGKGT